MLPSHRVRLRALPTALRGKGSTLEQENNRHNCALTESNCVFMEPGHPVVSYF